jgi:hypothetical protein
MTVEAKTIELINGLSNYTLFVCWKEIEAWVGISNYIDNDMDITQRQYLCLKRLYDRGNTPMPPCKVRGD